MHLGKAPSHGTTHKQGKAPKQSKARQCKARNIGKAMQVDKARQGNARHLGNEMQGTYAIKTRHLSKARHLARKGMARHLGRARQGKAPLQDT
jgi:hypothetical protein